MYGISVQQSHGYMSDKPETHVWKQEEITGIDIMQKAFTQIGATGGSAFCRHLVVRPSGLTIPIYISERDEEYSNVLETLRTVTNENVNRVTVTLSLKELPHDNYQTITIWKMKTE